MNCCGITPGDNAFELDFITPEAKVYAVEHQKTVAIYEEDGKLTFSDFDTAVQRGKTILSTVSQYL